MVALGAEAPAVGLGDLVALLVEEVDVIDLLDRPTGEARLCSIRSFSYASVEITSLRRTGLCQFQSAPDHIAWTPGKPADVAGHDAAGGKQEARQRDDAAVIGLGGVVGIAPQRIVVADAVRVVADVVARGLIAPRLGGRADRDADALAQIVKALLR